MEDYSVFDSPSWADISSNAKALFTLPTIGLPSQAVLNLTSGIQSVLGALKAVGLARGIPIYSYSQQEVGQNNIGDQIMLRAGELGTQVVTDNIAPLPREWKIEGYVKAPFVARMVGTDYFTQCSNSIIVAQAIKNYFRYLRTMRAPFQYISREGEIVDVLMVNYTFTDEPESEWATKISMHVKEYIALGVGKDAYSILNLPSLGGIFGNPAQYATAGTRVISSALNMFGR